MGLIKGLLGKLWSTAKSRFRLWIEYVLIAVAIVALAWVVATHSRNQRLQDKVQQLQQEQGSLRGKLDDVAAANDAQQKAIEEVNRLRKIDHGVLQALMDGVTDIYTRDAHIKKQLRELRTNNEKAKKFLDTPAPASVQCVLNHTPCTQGGDEDESGGAATAPGVAESVPASDTGASH